MPKYGAGRVALVARARAGGVDSDDAEPHLGLGAASGGDQDLPVQCHPSPVAAVVRRLTYVDRPADRILDWALWAAPKGRYDLGGCRQPGRADDCPKLTVRPSR